MKARFILAIVLALLVVPSFMWAQHDHGSKKQAPSGTMVKEHDGVQALLDEATAAFEQAASATEPAQRQAALESGRAKLAEFRKLFDKHHADMAEHMKSCPMMKDKSGHGSHANH